MMRSADVSMTDEEQPSKAEKWLQEKHKIDLGGILDGVVFRIGFGMLFGIVLNWGAAGFFMGDALARLGIVLVGTVYYYSGAWKKYKIIS